MYRIPVCPPGLLLWWSLLAAALLFPAPARAQKGLLTVSGTVVDGVSGKPVEFATVALLRPADSSVLQTTVTDKGGAFFLEQVPVADFLLRCTFIGYEPAASRYSPVPGQPALAAGKLQIRPEATTMAGVTVQSAKAPLLAAIDRKVYNVGSDLMAQTGSATDVLRNIPSLEVDLDGGISLRGAGDLMILINGRTSTLTGKSKTDLLQSLPANTIERVEVITNPSAQYRPDGTGGIINIVLKKETKGGWNGSVNGSIGNDDRYNGGLALGHKAKRWNLTANYSVRQDTRIRLSSAERTYFGEQGPVDYYNDESFRSTSRPLSHVLNAGLEYTLGKKDRLAFSDNYLRRQNLIRDRQLQQFYSPEKVLASGYERLRYDPEQKSEHNALLSWEHRFSKDGHELKVAVNESVSSEREDNRYTTHHLPAGRPPEGERLGLREEERQRQLSADYSRPLSKTTVLDAGYLSLFSRQEADFQSELYDEASRTYLPDAKRTNRFLYREANHALYATWRQRFKKFSYSGGLRTEGVWRRGNLVTRDSLFANHYLKLYPSLHLAWEALGGSVQLSYSKRINRPEGKDLNPFPKYRDPRNLEAGNPALLPEIIHSVELGYKWQNEQVTLVPALFYRNQRNGFTELVRPLNDSVLLTTSQNLSTDQHAGLELVATARAGKRVSTGFSATFFYNQIDASKLGYSRKKSIYTMSLGSNTTVSVTKTTRLQVSANYRSARLTPQGKVYPNFVLNTGLQQGLFKSKLLVTATASDLLQTLRKKLVLQTPFVHQSTTSWRNRRILYLGVQYRFGRAAKKATEEKWRYDDNF
ncbi:TonB-dependent receptor [Paraflavisolibacter sp. H34]|uniref:TonB-dependent receptor domain-containing protein n=1 Tax=Huijunlia imazamoxiresistens TaxID=3127457 RepID=UPI003016A6E9